MTGLTGRRVVVLGYGTSGRAAAAALAEEGATVLVSEAAALSDAPEPPAGVRVETGGHRPEHLDGADLVVTSPGLPPHAPILRMALDRELPVWSELELGARLCSVPFVAVTGTNGKTTTVHLLASAMRAAGVRATACGNVGHPFSAAAQEGFEALAVEASSFQLAFCHRFRPRVSVLLNLAPDHLDWHGTFDAYAEAKPRIVRAQHGPDVHIGARDEHAAATISSAAPCEVRWFRIGIPGAGEVGVVDGEVVWHTQQGLVALGVPRAPSRGFAADAAAAAAAALAFGVDADAVAHAVGSFEPLPHRGGVVAEVGGVRFVDESKATNPHAALAALEGVSDAILIAGGLAKGLDLSPLAAAAPRLRGVVAIGDAAPAVAATFAGLLEVRRAADMPDAVVSAFAMAQASAATTVILAPACASQDMFRDYRDRGERFAAAARQLPTGRQPVASGAEGRADA